MRDCVLKLLLKLFGSFVFVEVLKHGKQRAHWAASIEFGFGFNEKVYQCVSRLAALEVPGIAIFITTFDVDGMSGAKFVF